MAKQSKCNKQITDYSLLEVDNVFWKPTEQNNPRSGCPMPMDACGMSMMINENKKGKNKTKAKITRTKPDPYFLFSQ